MKILFVLPGLTVPHGGYRVVFEVASRLLAFGHEIAIHSLAQDLCKWFAFPTQIQFQWDYRPAGHDILVLCSPHSIDFTLRSDTPPRVVLFCQMLEHLFRPTNFPWQEKCGRFYASRHPLLAISRWNIDYIQKFKPFGSPIYYLQNGINLEHFPLESPALAPKDGHTVLVEGWQSNNLSKDPDLLAPKVALRLRAMGCRILAYSARNISVYAQVPHEYYQCPTLERMNDLYRRATILIKASKFDARACAPVEAMTKGTVTARAIIEGDDDLTAENSLRTPYEEEALFHVARKLLDNAVLRQQLAARCLSHAQDISWENCIGRFHDAILGREEKFKTAIVSIVYAEPEWLQTKQCIEACGVPVVYVERRPAGVGSLTEAVNRGLKECLTRHPDVENIWVVTNVTFVRDTLRQLEAALENHFAFGMIHPAFDSDHDFCRRVQPLPEASVQPVPFVELTAPLLRRSLLEKVGFFDETMPYWGQDLDYGFRVRETGLLVGVDQSTTISHTYLRNILSSVAHDATRRRAVLRQASDRPTKLRLRNKYGPDWAAVTGRRPAPETQPHQFVHA